MTDISFRTDEMPKDGTPIYIRTVHPFRFMPYKPNSQQAKAGIPGRWQTMNEHGGWDNCAHPLGHEWALLHRHASGEMEEKP